MIIYGAESCEAASAPRFENGIEYGTRFWRNCWVLPMSSSFFFRYRRFTASVGFPGSATAVTRLPPMFILAVRLSDWDIFWPRLFNAVVICLLVCPGSPPGTINGAY